MGRDERIGALAVLAVAFLVTGGGFLLSRCGTRTVDHAPILKEYALPEASPDTAGADTVKPCRQGLRGKGKRKGKTRKAAGSRRERTEADTMPRRDFLKERIETR